jgi:phosphate transport system substrate-binding protein
MQLHFKFYVLFLISFFAPEKIQALEITGAGASFPQLIYSKWAKAYEEKTGVRVVYKAVGSEEGVKRIKERTVDFGASDKPLSPEVLTKINLFQFPALIGGVVIVFNLKDVSGSIKLDGPTLANIFMGKIHNWSHPDIQKLNAHMLLPDKDITVVHRSDGSGTTYLFTDYLSKISSEWKKKVGTDTSIYWPRGLGGKGNEGVATYVKSIEGSIGYVEYAYALQSDLKTSLLQNKDGAMVAASEKSFEAAFANVDWNSSTQYFVNVINQTGAESWPITGASFILMQTGSTDKESTKEVLKFFEWAFESGSKMALQSNYVPLNSSLVSSIKQSWKETFNFESAP